MKAIFIAVLLSLFAVSIPLQANTSPPQVPQKQAVTTNKINLNNADLTLLTGSFKGIGKKRAEAIIAYRDVHQGFKSIEELAAVKGLGQRFVEVNRDKLNEVYVIN